MNKKQIEAQKIGGKMLSEVMEQLMKEIQPGMDGLELDRRAEELITKKGGYPGFKKVPGYRHATCISVNDVVVHGIPNNRQFKKGDVVSIDSGVYYDGFHTDITETVVIGMEPKDEVERFLNIGKKTMFRAIEEAVVGKRIGNISQTIQEGIESAGYSVVRGLIGHGVGKQLHEDPEIPGYVEMPIEKTPEIKEGMVLAVEAIYVMGKKDMYVEEDDWTIATRDGKISGVFERTVYVRGEGKPEILTSLKGDERHR